MRRPARTRTLLGWIAVAFVGVWIVGTVVLIAAAGERGADDYVERLQAAGSPVVLPTGADRVEIRSGPVLVTLSVAEEAGRWYLSLLPPGGREPG